MPLLISKGEIFCDVMRGRFIVVLLLDDEDVSCYKTHVKVALCVLEKVLIHFCHLFRLEKLSKI